MPNKGRTASLPATVDAFGEAAHATTDTPTSVLRFAQSAPVFSASRATLERLLAGGTWPSLADLSAKLGVRCEPDERGGPRRGLRRRSDLYDARITERAALPTRAENWHDLFNVVTWTAFPRAKRALHARQYRRLCERVPELFERLPGERTKEQNALTQLDEGGLLLSLPASTSPATTDALTVRLRALSMGREPLTNEHLAAFGAHARIFGHALHEHLALGAPPPRAAVFMLPCPPGQLDAALAALLEEDTVPFPGVVASAWITPQLDTRG